MKGALLDNATCSLRRCLALAAVAALVAVPMPTTAANGAQRVTMSAQQIALYSDRGVLIADGGVTLHVGDRTISATHAAYAMQANRFVLVGGVSVAGAGERISGNAYVYDIAAHRGSIVANDAASVPQLDSSTALAIGQQVQIAPQQTIVFTNAQVRVGSTFQPVASYTYAIPPPRAKDFGSSPVPSAGLDYAFRVHQTDDLFTFGSLRYDKYFGGPGLSLEEHYARTDRGYAALGETLDADGGRIDLGAYQRINASVSQSLSALHSRGYSYARYALSQAGRTGYATLSASQSNAWNAEDLDLSTVAHPLGALGTYRLETDVGIDVHPGDYPIPSAGRASLAMHLASATVTIAHAHVASTYDVYQTAYDYGRNRTSSTVAFTLSRALARYLAFYGGASFAQNDDRFPLHAQPSASQDPCKETGASPLLCFVPPPGASTYRTYTGAVNYDPNPHFGLYLGLQYAHDFPQYVGYGRPEFAGSFNLRIVRKDGRGVVLGGIVPFGSVGNFYRASVFNIQLIR